MRSFDGQGDERRIALAERYVTVFGARAPVLDAAEGCYDGVHLLVAVAASGALTARGVGAASARLLAGADDRLARWAWSAAPLGPPPMERYLARADGLDLTVIKSL